MKSYRYIIAAAAAVLSLAACSKNELQEPETQKEGKMVQVTLGADFASVKTSLATDGKVLWSASDKIKVQVGQNAYDFELTSGSGSQTATFTGVVSENDAAVIKGTAAGTVSAFYPTSGASVPATQTWAENTFADNTFPMTASFTGPTDTPLLSFSTNAAVVRVQAVAASATSAVLSYTVSETEHNVTMDNLPTTADKDLYFVIVPGSQQFNLSVDGAAAVSYTTSAETEAGSRYNLGEKYKVQIGDVKYETLAAAFDAVQDDETIEVLANASITSKIYVDKDNVTLDLNDKTVTCCVSGDYHFHVDLFRKFTITDGVFVDGTNDASLGVIYADNTHEDDLIIITNPDAFDIIVSNVDFGVFDAQDNCTTPFNTKNGTLIKFSHTSTYSHGTPACTLTNVRAASDHGILDYVSAVSTTITNGKYIVNHNSPCSDAGCGNSVIALNMPKCDPLKINNMTDVTVIATNCNIAVAGYVNLNNCTVNCDNYALVLSNTEKMNITGGTYTAGTDAVRVQGSGGTITINSGTFTGGTNALAAYLDNTQGTTTANINVSDGTFSGNLATGDNNCNIQLSGGTYSVNPSADYIASGFKAEANGTTPETWTVKSDIPTYCEGVGKYSAPAIYVAGKWWAPVNLGYEPANGDYKGYPYGKLYQWGRKYGQGYKDKTYEDADYPGKSGGSQTIETLTKTTKLTTYPDGDTYNGTFYSVSGNWYAGTNPAIQELWDSNGSKSTTSSSSHVSKKTQYDPCPTGWRLPTYGELSALKSNKSGVKTSTHGTTSNVKGTYFYDSDKEEATGVFLPVAGRINTGGTFANRGSSGYYYSSAPSGTNNGWYLNMGSSTYMSSQNMAYGGSVRCVKE